MVPWLVRSTLTMALYKTNVFMKLFNMTSTKFGKRGGTNMQSIKATHGICSVMAIRPSDRRQFGVPLVTTAIYLM
jgi:hypothetical protein